MMSDLKDKADSLLWGRKKSEGSPVEQIDDTRSQLNLVTQETRFVLIQNIVAHPKGMPSLKELSYANPSKSTSTIRNHLDKLIDAGIVETARLPKDQRRRNLPHRFFRLSESGRDFLEKHDLLKAEETLKEMHSMLEKTPEYEKYLEAPRPGDPENDDDEKTDNTRRVLKP